MTLSMFRFLLCPLRAACYVMACIVALVPSVVWAGPFDELLKAAAQKAAADSLQQRSPPAAAKPAPVTPAVASVLSPAQPAAVVGNSSASTVDGHGAPQATTQVTAVPLGMNLAHSREPVFTRASGVGQVTLSNPYLDSRAVFFVNSRSMQCSADGSLVVGGTAGLDKDRNFTTEGFWRVAPSGAVTALHVRRKNAGNRGFCGVHYSQARHGEFRTSNTRFLLTTDGRLLFGTDMSVMQIDPDGTLRKLAGAPESCGDGYYSPSKFAGLVDGPADLARFRNARAMAEDTQGNIWVSDQVPGGAGGAGCALRKIAPDGQVSTVLGTERICAKGTKPEDFINMGHMAWDAANGELVTAGDYLTPNQVFTTVWRIKPDGTVRRVYLGTKVGPAKEMKVDGASALAVDSKGQIYIGSKDMALFMNTRQLLRVTEPGSGVVAVTGGRIAKGDTTDMLVARRDGASDRATFQGINSVCMLADGTGYIFDLPSYTIRRMDRQSQWTTWVW